MAQNNFGIQGLTREQVQASQARYGKNRLLFKSDHRFLGAVKSLLKEPMVILLLVTSTIYFVSGSEGDGIFLAAAIVLVSAISLYQDSRSHKALEKLRDITQPVCRVIRDAQIVEIRSEDVVVGDSMLVEEGTAIPADGTIVHSNDFSVNESILTGESLPVYKDKSKDDQSVYCGTTVASGLAIATVHAIGNETRLGKIGKSLEHIEEEKTPLELQINNFVKGMVLAGSLVFVIVWVINFLNSGDMLDSLLKSLALAMSILPEEIPVAFTTFMALGGWRLMRMGIVVKQMKTVETLGSATVICADKTGTITENRMSLAKIYCLEGDELVDAGQVTTEEQTELITLAMWASEPIPFDPMEAALHEAYGRYTKVDERSRYQMIHEYALSGIPPMMTHIFEDEPGNRIIAAKGAPEAMMEVSSLNDEEKARLSAVISTLSSEGYRILGVGTAAFHGDGFPLTQQEFVFKMKGIVAFYDPPKENIRSVFEDFYKAGITVKIVTGDNLATTTAIAKAIGFAGADKSITGAELMRLNDGDLQECVARTQLFARMFPEAKLRIIDALKKAGQIVAMTGDGVNDGPALKAAHIGIAMGKKGAEIARQSASLILMEDDLSKMIDAIAMGRKIYNNLKKAIQYIISIHIPIILTVFIPLALGWIYPNIFSPVHIIFLELIMGPTCSIIYENEPMEKNTLLQKPRLFTYTFFNWRELTTSIVQGLMITAGTLLVYQYAVSYGLNEAVTRTMVFTTLLSSNIFLTLVNRSFYYSVFTTIRYQNNLVPLIIGLTLAISALLLYVQPLTGFFDFESLSPFQLGLSLLAGFLFVIWYEGVKVYKQFHARIQGNANQRVH